MQTIAYRMHDLCGSHGEIEASIQNSSLLNGDKNDADDGHGHNSSEHGGDSKKEKDKNKKKAKQAAGVLVFFATKPQKPLLKKTFFQRLMSGTI